MLTEEIALNFDPRYEDSEELKALSRRGFIGRIAGGLAAGTALLSITGKSRANPPFPADKMADPTDISYWNWVADQFMIREGVSFMNTGTRGPSPKSVHQAQIAALEGVNTDYKSYSKYVYSGEFRKKMHVTPPKSEKQENRRSVRYTAKMMLERCVDRLNTWRWRSGRNWSSSWMVLRRPLWSRLSR